LSLKTRRVGNSTTTTPAQIIAVREVLNSARRIDCRKAFDSQLGGCGAVGGGAKKRGCVRVGEEVAREREEERRVR
jgi:hypothetical protein